MFKFLNKGQKENMKMSNMVLFYINLVYLIWKLDKICSFFCFEVICKYMQLCFYFLWFLNMWKCEEIFKDFIFKRIICK